MSCKYLTDIAKMKIAQNGGIDINQDSQELHEIVESMSDDEIKSIEKTFEDIGSEINSFAWKDSWHEWKTEDNRQKEIVDFKNKYINSKEFRLYVDRMVREIYERADSYIKKRDYHLLKQRDTIAKLRLVRKISSMLTLEQSKDLDNLYEDLKPFQSKIKKIYDKTHRKVDIDTSLALIDYWGFLSDVQKTLVTRKMVGISGKMKFSERGFPLFIPKKSEIETGMGKEAWWNIVSVKEIDSKKPIVVIGYKDDNQVIVKNKDL